jgi:RimJ/RimL family protein N-acetyltransferase
MLERYENQPKLNLPNSIKIDDDFEARQFNAKDGMDIAKIAADVAVKKYIPWAIDVSDLQSAEEQIAKFDDQYEKGFSIRYGIYSNEDACVGYFGVWQNDSEPYSLETGSAILPGYRGRGLSNKCRSAIMQIAKQQGYKKLISFLEHSNQASRSMLLKAGYKPTGILNARGEEKYELSLENE